jgi:hypothetical protein
MDNLAMGEPGFPLTGGGRCGAVRFEVGAPLGAAIYCHCTRCQRRTGTGASVTARVESASFKIASGEDKLRAWRPDGGWEKSFCGCCGSAVYSRHPIETDRTGVRLGAFDGDPGVRPVLRQFVAYAAPWEPIPDDGLPRYPESSHSHWAGGAQSCEKHGLRHPQSEGVAGDFAA